MPFLTSCSPSSRDLLRGPFPADRRPHMGHRDGSGWFVSEREDGEARPVLDPPPGCLARRRRALREGRGHLRELQAAGRALPGSYLLRQRELGPAQHLACRACGSLPSCARRGLCWPRASSRGLRRSRGGSGIPLASRHGGGSGVDGLYAPMGAPPGPGVARRVHGERGFRGGNAPRASFGMADLPRSSSRRGAFDRSPRGGVSGGARVGASNNLREVSVVRWFSKTQGSGCSDLRARSERCDSRPSAAAGPAFWLTFATDLNSTRAWTFSSTSATTTTARGPRSSRCLARLPSSGPGSGCSWRARGA